MIYPIPPGLFCIPSALCALTGRDPVAVITPALNRHSKHQWLHDVVTAEFTHVAVAVLEELGYYVRPYKDNAEGGQLRVTIKTWARRSAERWPGRTLLVTTAKHALVICDGTVYDTWEPMGRPGDQHPFSRTIVDWAALVEKKNA